MQPSVKLTPPTPVAVTLPRIPRQILVIALATLALLVLWQAAALSKLRIEAAHGGPCPLHAAGTTANALPDFGPPSLTEARSEGALRGVFMHTDTPAGSADPTDARAVDGGRKPVASGEFKGEPQPQPQPEASGETGGGSEPQPEAEDAPGAGGGADPAHEEQPQPDPEPQANADVDGNLSDGIEAEGGGGPLGAPPHLHAVRVNMPERSPEELSSRGLPEDSWRLPNQPDWDPSMWPAEARPDPWSAEWPNSVAICALMKDEHPDDVAEWLRYHKWLGIDHVFLAENAEEVPEGIMPRIQGLVDEGFVEVTTLPGPKHPLQNRWYNRCSKPDMAGGHSWVAFLDLDEFMVILDGCVIIEGVAAPSPQLKSVLQKFKDSAGLSLQWVMFGSSGHVERPPGGPLANFDKCSGELSYETKCVANMFHTTHHMFASDTVHDCTYKVEDGNFQEPPVLLSDGEAVRFYNNTQMINPQNDPDIGMSRGYPGHLNQDTYNHKITSDHKLVLFHYATRSLEDYTGRKIIMPAGIYAHTYAKYGKDGDVNVTDAVVMREFESANGFDGDAPICSSAAVYVTECCGDQ